MSYKMSWKNWIVADKNNFIGHDRQIIKRPAHLSIVLGLGKRPKSSGEAWRVLAMQRYELFPNHTSFLLKIGPFPNFYWFSYGCFDRKSYLCCWLLDVCYTDAYKHFATF